MKMQAPAKINLALDVVKRRPDGYHDVDMIMHSIALYDVVDVVAKLSGSGANEIVLTSDSNNIPTDERNTAYKAAELFAALLGKKISVRIDICKKIPQSAGLAGGSTDAAAVLEGLNKIFGNAISREVLLSESAKIGCDVPFCLMKGTARATGRGEILAPITEFKGAQILIVKPDFDVSTPWVYRNLVLDESTKHPDISKIVQYIEQNNTAKMCAEMGNVLESVTANTYPEIDKIKAEMCEYGAVGALMSGSGSSVFGIFNERNSAEKAFAQFKQKYENTFLTV